MKPELDFRLIEKKGKNATHITFDDKNLDQVYRAVDFPARIKNYPLKH